VIFALAPLPFIIPAYCVSKATALSLTQSLRALVAGQGVRVHTVLPGPVDTDMTGGSDRSWSWWRSRSRTSTLYNYDYDADYPAEGRALKDALASVDALLFVTPEYNRS